MKEFLKGIWYYFGITQSFLLNLFVMRPKVFYEDDTKQNKRVKGRTIVISNHQNILDGLVVMQKYYFRRIHYVIADFFKTGIRRVCGLLIRSSGGILVDREAYSFDFFEKSKKLLNQDKLILIYPEGRLAFEYEPIRFTYSYVALSVHTGAKIVPIASDCNYTPFGRVHILVGNSIEPYRHILPEQLTREKLKEINEDIHQQFVLLYYQLKKKKYANLSSTYRYIPMKQGDMIRIPCGTYHHYGVYLSKDEVLQFGRAETATSESQENIVHAVSLKEFCGDKIPEVRVFTKREIRRYRRETKDIAAYARQCVGQGHYSAFTNNCFDFATRVILK